MYNPITVICPITPTVTDPITKMEVAHTVGLGRQDTTGQDEACYPSFGQKKVKKKFSSPFSTMGYLIFNGCRQQ